MNNFLIFFLGALSGSALTFGTLFLIAVLRVQSVNRKFEKLSKEVIDINVSKKNN